MEIDLNENWSKRKRTEPASDFFNNLFVAAILNAQGTTAASLTSTKTRQQPTVLQQNKIPRTCTTKPVYEKKKPPKAQVKLNKDMKKRIEESSETSGSESEYEAEESSVKKETFGKLKFKKAVKEDRKESQNFDHIFNSVSGDNHEPATIQDSAETVGLWHGDPVGLAAKELLEAVENRYPWTFERVQIRFKRILLITLKEFHEIIKAFLETSVDELTEEQITSFREDLKEFERSGFDLSWAHKRLNMVEKLKFGNQPLKQELMALEESLEPLKERLNERQKQFNEARDMLEKARLEYDDAKDARNSKARELAKEFGDDYDLVLKGQLGFGMLPGY